MNREYRITNESEETFALAQAGVVYKEQMVLGDVMKGGRIVEQGIGARDLANPRKPVDVPVIIDLRFFPRYFGGICSSS